MDLSQVGCRIMMQVKDRCERQSLFKEKKVMARKEIEDNYAM
jgi:hypothetical protein